MYVEEGHESVALGRVAVHGVLLPLLGALGTKQHAYLVVFHDCVVSVVRCRGLSCAYIRTSLQPIGTAGQKNQTKVMVPRTSVALRGHWNTTGTIDPSPTSTYAAGAPA